MNEFFHENTRKYVRMRLFIRKRYLAGFFFCGDCQIAKREKQAIMSYEW